MKKMSHDLHLASLCIYLLSICWQSILVEKSLKMGPLMASDFGTDEYFHTSNAKTAVVLDVLKRGYAVLMIDPDIILFKNPFPYFNCTSCDVHFQMDRDMYNRYIPYI